MTSLFQKRTITYILILVISFLLLIGTYFFLYRPQVEELHNKKIELQMKQESKEFLLEKLEELEGKTGDDFEEWKNRLPVSKELDQLILILEEMEQVSNSTFERITFSYSNSLNSVDGQEEDKSTNKEFNMLEQPAELHVITIRMNVITPDYQRFQTFLKEIEKQERWMYVNELEFLSTGDSEELEPAIHSQVQLVTFYYKE